LDRNFFHSSPRSGVKRNEEGDNCRMEDNEGGDRGRRRREEKTFFTEKQRRRERWGYRGKLKRRGDGNDGRMGLVCMAFQREAGRQSEGVESQ